MCCRQLLSPAAHSSCSADTTSSQQQRQDKAHLALTVHSVTELCKLCHPARQGGGGGGVHLRHCVYIDGSMAAIMLGLVDDDIVSDADLACIPDADGGTLLSKPCVKHISAVT